MEYEWATMSAMGGEKGVRRCFFLPSGSLPVVGMSAVGLVGRGTYDLQHERESLGFARSVSTNIRCTLGGHIYNKSVSQQIRAPLSYSS